MKQLETMLAKRLLEYGVAADFSLAITDVSSMWILLQGTAFEASNFRFDAFRIYLGNTVKKQSGRECYLHLHINHLFAFLLRQLYYLLFPSLLFLLFLVASFLLLLRSLNQWQRLDRIKNDFINHLTHELKNPVFAISMSSNLIKQQPTQWATYLPFIEKETQKLKTYIDKVLELASFERGQHQLRQEQIDVQELIEEVVAAFQLQVAATSAKIYLDFQAFSPQLLLDRLHFANSLSNLIDNSLKYNDKIPVITISTRAERNIFYIQVKDNGIGIPKPEQKYIFDKFYRVKNKNHAAKYGFGLGLSYVQQIVQAHRGRVKVESELGQYTIFTIQLPIE
ncbi:MAG: HAMP domain-containing histidine kinase [Saprospiraceae bacterium]|nr:HAMP domain-containing histidine kinase [Saprospiraceae bacterium]